jgi:hypothetical protein
MPTLKAIFPSPEKAKEFADHFGIVGLRAKVVLENKSVEIATDDAKSFEFIKQMVRDIREDSRSDRHIVRLLSTIRECAVGDRSFEMGLLDGSAAKIGSDFARRFLSLYEKLSDEARRKMCFISVESKESHAKAVQFVMGGN